MSDSNDRLPAEIEDLKSAYRRIQAPPELATRIMAHARSRSAASVLRWWPAVAALVLTAVLTPWLMHGGGQQPTRSDRVYPSMFVLGDPAVLRPVGSSPALANVVRIPLQPKTPQRSYVNQEPAKPHQSMNRPTLMENNRYETG